MRTPVRIIKRNYAEAIKELPAEKSEKSVEQSTREMVGTVKSWIAEFQDRKRAQRHSFALLPVTATGQTGKT
jgi:hypothetical protein